MVLNNIVNELVNEGANMTEQELQIKIAGLLTGFFEFESGKIIYPDDHHVKQLKPLLVSLTLTSDKLKKLAKMVLNKEWVTGDYYHRVLSYLDLSDTDSLFDGLPQGPAKLAVSYPQFEAIRNRINKEIIKETITGRLSVSISVRPVYDKILDKSILYLGDI